MFWNLESGIATRRFNEEEFRIPNSRPRIPKPSCSGIWNLESQPGVPSVHELRGEAGEVESTAHCVPPTAYCWHAILQGVAAAGHRRLGAPGRVPRLGAA